MEITFITGNVSKAEQLSRHLNYPVSHKKADVHEIQSLDLREIAEHKAREAQKIVGGIILVEDTSLVFHALKKLPGPLIKWFLTILDNDGLCKLLNNYRDRSATASVCFALYDGKTLNFFEAEQRGTITETPKGDRGFGWDPVFIPEGSKKTWGEMSTEEQNSTSMRKVALKKLSDFLKNND